MEDFLKFRCIVQYCKMMNYDINDILDMSTHELRLWYERVTKMMEDEIKFRINTGRIIE